MAKRRMLVALVAVVLFCLTATGTALGSEARGHDDRPGRGQRACAALQHRIHHLRAAIGKLEAVADRLEAKIASGELTPEQQARARHVLAKIEAAQERLEERLRKLLEVYEERCED